MTINIIGTGLNTWDNLTVKSVDLLKKADLIYLEGYTSLFGEPIEVLEKMISKKVTILTRQEFEESNTLINENKNKEVCLLVIGDPLAATTHTELILRLKENKIRYNVIHNTSVFNAISETGLQLYKFGRTISLPFFDKYPPESVYNNIIDNQKMGLHSLILLDIKAEENKFMTINEAIEHLIKLENKFKKNLIKENLKIVACARLTHKDQVIKYGKIKDILKEDFGKQPHCLIIPGKMHFLEEEFVEKN
jgi:diphthine synthase